MMIIEIPSYLRKRTDLEIIKYVEKQLKAKKMGYISDFTITYTKDNSKVILKPLKK